MVLHGPVQLPDTSFYHKEPQALGNLSLNILQTSSPTKHSHCALNLEESFESHCSIWKEVFTGSTKQFGLQVLLRGYLPPKVIEITVIKITVIVPYWEGKSPG